MTATVQRTPALARLYVKAALALAPGAQLVPGLPGGGGAVPEMALALEGVRIDPERLGEYRRTCGFAQGGAVPATYPHVLAFPLQMALMTEGGFPFGPVGLVHIENRLAWRGPISEFEPLDLRVRCGAMRAHAKGRSFVLHSEARAGGELVWQEHSTMLRRESRANGDSRPQQSDAGGRQETSREAVSPELPETAVWCLPSDLGRRYAAVSGDRNPIHLHPLAARCFGFQRAIAHGMWSIARCLAQLQHRTAGAGTMQAVFRRPLELPAEASFCERRAGAGTHLFELRSRRDPNLVHMHGSARFA